MMASPVAEIEQVKAIVDRHFPVYETRVAPEILSLFVRVDPFTLEEHFDALRKELKAERYIPTIMRDAGEYVVHVQRKREVRYKSVRVNVALLAITLATTTVAGMDNWASYDGAPLWSASTLGYGILFFSLPLMTILGVHELGHYLAARKHNVHSSLPFFIPVPPFFSPLGTFGAFISMRDPIPDRKSLLDIGLSGPVVGFLVALPVAMGGLFLTATTANPLPQNVGDGVTVAYQLPILYQGLMLFFPMPEDVLFHPLAFAGWVGLFVTALNLLPAGQLDGGHVARAVLGENARYLSYGALLTMILLGMFFPGWIIIALIIIFLGARHPPPLNDLTKLDNVRKGAGAMAAVIMILTFVPFPAVQIMPTYSYEFHDFDRPGELITGVDLNASANSTLTLPFILNSTANSKITVNVTTELNAVLIADGWGLYLTAEGYEDPTFWVNLTLNSSESAVVVLIIEVPDASPGNYTVKVHGEIMEGGGSGITRELHVNVRVQ
jgi:membrane-associated protease RseP (regulator of RpoE activity)